MSARAVLIVGALFVTGSGADARTRVGALRSEDVPLPVERPFSIDGLRPLTIRSKPPRSAAVGPSLADAREIGTPSKPGNTEAAAPTPGGVAATPSEGPRESPAPTLRDLVTRHARDNGVPMDLAQAVIRIESRGNPLASHRGALGLMQIKPGTARAVGFSGGAAGLLVADTNLRYGMKILGQALRTSGGDVCRALMLYQSGHLATRMSAANRVYCSKARAFMAGA